MRITHIALWTADLERMTAFWAEMFDAIPGGLYHSARRPGFSSRFLRLPEGPTLELMTAPWLAGDIDPGRERPGWAHVAISVGSESKVRDLAARLTEEGALVSPPRLTGDGYYEAVVRDPDGNLIEITV
jgi:lactoylglutathione lyase